MKLFASRDVAEYLYALRDAMGSSTDFGVERFTGLVIGKFFCVTHHCGYDCGRRVSHVKNTAIGYVKKVKDGSEICFITTKGDLRPQMLVPEWVISFLLSFLLTGNAIFGWYLSFHLIVIAILSAIASWITEPGMSSWHNLLSLLKGPVNPYDHLTCERCVVTHICDNYAYVQFDKGLEIVTVPLDQLPKNIHTGQKLLFSNNEYWAI